MQTNYPSVRRHHTTNRMGFGSIKHFLQINNTNCYNYHMELKWNGGCVCDTIAAGEATEKELSNYELSNRWLNGFCVRRFECLSVCLSMVLHWWWIRVNWLPKWTLFQKTVCCKIKWFDLWKCIQAGAIRARCYAVLWCDVIHFAHKFCNCIESEI